MLGGGVRAGSLVLVGGGPGLGKSTLLLQLAALAAAAPPWRAPAGSPLAGASDRVLYITGEEAAEQVADRAERLQVDDCGRVDVLCENNMDVILEVLHERRPKVAILDSVQTVSLADVSGSNGSVSQVRPPSDRCFGPFASAICCKLSAFSCSCQSNPLQILRRGCHDYGLSGVLIEPR